MNCKNCGNPTQAFYLEFCSSECAKDYRRKKHYQNSETYLQEKEHLALLQNIVTKEGGGEQ